MDEKELQTVWDSLTEEDLQQWDIGDLPKMEDTLAEQRIKALVRKKVAVKKRRFSQKSIVAASILCLLGIGALTTEPVQATLEKLIHFIPSIGVVEGKTAYEAEIICGELQQGEYLTATLTDVYCKDNFLTGTVTIVDTSPYVHYETETNEKKYDMYWYDDTEEAGIVGTEGVSILQEEYHNNQYRRVYQKPIFRYLEEPKDTLFEIAVDGFDQKFSFCLRETESVSDLESIGNTATVQGNTIMAKAELTEEGAKVSYYGVFSPETLPIFKEKYAFFSMNVLPYGFDEKDTKTWSDGYLVTKDGRTVPPKKTTRLPENGGELFFDVTAEDFPATYHHLPLSGILEEQQIVELPVPEMGETRSVDIPVNMTYGTIHVTELSRREAMVQTGEVAKDAETGEETQVLVQGDVLQIKAEITSNQNDRTLYSVSMDTADDMKWYGWVRQFDVTQKPIQIEYEIECEHVTEDTIEVVWKDPVYWIEGEFVIPVDISKGE